MWRCRSVPLSRKCQTAVRLQPSMPGDGIERISAAEPPQDDHKRWVSRRTHRWKGKNPKKSTSSTSEGQIAIGFRINVADRRHCLPSVRRSSSTAL